jgi:predicted RNA-binding protein with PUA-like domain
MADRQYWLVKQEPEAYSWDDFVKDGKTNWTGVRNFQARNNLAAMKKGDQVLFYHSVSDKQIVGIAQVSRASFPDPTAREGNWCAVELTPVRVLSRPVALEEIKKDPILKGIALVRQSRLSVTPLSPAEFNRILDLAH